MKPFSEKVKDARASAGMSQLELARLVGVSLKSISCYEAGTKMPRRKTLLQLAKALNVSIKFLSDDECEDPVADMEKDDYIQAAQARYGSRGGRDVEELLKENTALFAGGELSQEQKDEFFNAVMDAYVICRNEAKKKFGRKEN